MKTTSAFDIVVRHESGNYTVAVQSAYGIDELPPKSQPRSLNLSNLPQQRNDVANWVRTASVITRRSNSEALQAARNFGTSLFQTLFPNDIADCFQKSRAILQASSSNERLCLRLCLPPELHALPWELLYDPYYEQFLVLAPDLILTRYLEAPIAILPRNITGSLQIAVVLASPTSNGYPPLNLNRELRRINEAFQPLIEQERIQLDIISGHNTLGQLRERLRRPLHVLHLMCHGDIDEQSGEGLLIFEDTDGQEQPIGAELLKMYLEEQRGQTQLVLVNSCLGAVPVANDPFSSIGASLIRGGVQAVIAMQFEQPDDTAAALSQVFYAEIAAGQPVDLALMRARRHIYGLSKQRLDWAIPVLFLRSASGQLFDISDARHSVSPAGAQLPAAPSPLASLPRYLPRWAQLRYPALGVSTLMLFGILLWFKPWLEQPIWESLGTVDANNGWQLARVNDTLLVASSLNTGECNKNDDTGLWRKQGAQAAWERVPYLSVLEDKSLASCALSAIKDLALDPADNKRIYGATSSVGLIYSEDPTFSDWKRVPTDPFSQTRLLSFVTVLTQPAGRVIVAGKTYNQPGGLFAWTPSTSSWERLDGATCHKPGFVGLPLNFKVGALLSTATTLYVGTTGYDRSSVPAEGGVYRSTDGGICWQKIDEAIIPGHGHSSYLALTAVGQSDEVLAVTRNWDADGESKAAVQLWLLRGSQGRTVPLWNLNNPVWAVLVDPQDRRWYAVSESGDAATGLLDDPTPQPLPGFSECANGCFADMIADIDGRTPLLLINNHIYRLSVRF